jgi:uncharacterized protein DUF5343
MALQAEGGPAPYAPPSAVTTGVEAFRNRGLTIPFTPEVLVRAGVTEGLAPRTYQALRLIDLIDEAGNPTAELVNLRRAPEEEYRDRFAEVIRAAYAPIFQFADPATDPPQRVRDAFRPYEPVGQQGRMVTLFLGLCEYTGIIESSPRRAPAEASTRRTSPQPRTRQRDRSVKDKGTDSKGALPKSVPPALAAFLQELPPVGGSWTSQQRKRFIDTFTTLLDYSYEVEEAPAPEGGES